MHVIHAEPSPPTPLLCPHMAHTPVLLLTHVSGGEARGGEERGGRPPSRDRPERARRGGSWHACMSFMQSPHPPPPFFAHPWHTHTSSCCPHMCQVQQPGPEAQPVTEPTGGGVAPDPAKAPSETGDKKEVRGGSHVIHAEPSPPTPLLCPHMAHTPVLLLTHVSGGEARGGEERGGRPPSRDRPERARRGGSWHACMSFMQSPHPPPPFFAHPWHTHTSSCCPHMCQVQQPGPEAQPVTEPTGGGVAPDPAKATLVTGDPEEVRGGTHVMRAAPPPPPLTHTHHPHPTPLLCLHMTHTHPAAAHTCVR